MTLNAISRAAANAPGPGRGFLGIVMLDTQFPRPPGDIGNAQTFAGPTRRLVVPRAWPAAVVAHADTLRASGLEKRFVEAVQTLRAEGASAITTSCGFLVLLQRELQAAVDVPMLTSSLLLLPGVLQRERQQGRRRVGVLTISAASLGIEHLLSAGVLPEQLSDVVVQGVDPQGEFATCILGNHTTMDLARASQDVVDAALALRKRAPDIHTVVLECTNMPPARGAIEKATGLSALWLGHCEALRPFGPLGVVHD